MEKQVIGTWSKYNVALHKSGKRFYWTIEDKDGTEHNKFYSSESFGHWVYHSGFKPFVVQNDSSKKVKYKLVVYSGRGK